MLVKLPNGLVEGSDLFTHVQVDELRGKQQNYLATKELVVGNIGHVPKILEDMILSIETKEGIKWQGDLKEAIWKFSSGDLETILIKIRENTYGNKYYFEAECPHCEHNNKNQRLDLDKLKVDGLTAKKRLDEKRLEITLPKAQLGAVLKPIYLKDMFEVIKITSDKEDKLITSIIALSLAKLGEKTAVTDEDIDDLSMKDIAYIEDQMASIKIEGSIDTDIEMTCSKCKEDFSTKLNVYDPNFFAPSSRSTT
jgi:hypothetical protein